MSAKNGLADGTSIYSLANGTQVLTGWHEGQKHGSYRMVTSAGIVLKEGRYEDGRRTGIWTSRDDAGNTMAVGSYLLGLRHGTHQRFEMTTQGRPRLVESSPYVLGLKHGRGKFRDTKSGLIVEGNFQWNQRHGRFVASEPGAPLERIFVCDKPNKGVVYLSDIQWIRRCKAAAPIYLPKLAKASNVKRSARALMKALCASRDKLGVPVLVDGKPLSCSEPLAAATESKRFRRLVTNFLRAENVVDGFEYEFRNSNVTTARFTQRIVRTNPWRMSQSRGNVHVYKQRRSAWTFRSKRYCQLLTSGNLGATVSPKSAPMVASHGDILEWTTVFAYSEAEISNLYRTKIVSSSANDIAVVLTPKKQMTCSRASPLMCRTIATKASSWIGQPFGFAAAPASLPSSRGCEAPCCPCPTKTSLLRWRLDRLRGFAVGRPVP